MIREKIKEVIDKKGVSVRSVAIACELEYNNFVTFLAGTRKTFPLRDIEKVCEYLNLELQEKRNIPDMMS